MSPPVRIAVVGGGVSACSLAYGLRHEIARNEISLSVFEMGRTSGGRATTRRTREWPELRVDHGAPAFSVKTSGFATLCEEMARVGALKQCDLTTMPFGLLTKDGHFKSEDTPPLRYAPSKGKGMSVLCDTLLRSISSDEDGPPLVQTIYGTMVGRVEKADLSSPWHLHSKKGDHVGAFDWLVVTSTGIAHPRWRTTFGGEPPLVEAAWGLGDTALDLSLAALAPMKSYPVTACLCAYTGEAAAAWASLPFYKATIEQDETLARVVVQRLSHDLTTVVLHSTHTFAEKAAKVYGSSSTAARLAGAASDGEVEGKILDDMLAAAEARLGHLGLPREIVRGPAWGPLLHRWGAAFPEPGVFTQSDALVPSAKVAFAGDYVDVGDGRVGTVEGAALSGLRTAEALLQELGKA